MQQTGDLLLDTALALHLLAAVAAGLLIGIERGWRQRGEADGMRVAGVRTFTLIAGTGGLAAVVAQTVSPGLAAVVLAGLAGGLLFAFVKDPAPEGHRDATTMVAAFVALLLGLLAGAGQPALAVAGAALVTLVLATREQSHRLLRKLSGEEVQSIARFAVISVAVLPFLPNSEMGPYDAWNPFQLWLVVVFVTGFSVLGYTANRLVGRSKGTIATALIGGAYSSTAVTASLAARLRDGGQGPLSTGIVVASAVMYLRVLALVAILAPRATMPLLVILAPAALVAWVAAGAAWRFDSSSAAAEPSDKPAGKPFQFLPALGFLVAVAGAALLIRWAEAEFGEAAGAWSLFIAGSFGVDAAIVALSSLPAGSISSPLAALAIGGTVGVNMAFKIGVVLANARLAGGRPAAAALLASLVVLLLTLGWRFLQL